VTGSPEIAVVVPSHDRPLRLRWLLNALEEQTLERNRWEVVVAHDSAGPETDELLQAHPLAQAEMLRHVRLPPGSAPPGANRNAGWREARGSVIAFTDDDCRPPPEWLERSLDAARRHPGAVVQGRTVPDPHEAYLIGVPSAFSQYIEPPGPYAQACNIVYPRELLERLGGFDEVFHAGEDADLALRARKSGAAYVGAPEALTYHAVTTPTLLARLRGVRRWGDLPGLMKRHPEHRAEYPLRIFWGPRHPYVPLALAAALLGRRDVRLCLLALPWALHAFPRHGPSPLGWLRALAHLPGRALLDLAEIAVLARGSATYRTLFL
jgi:glycosyltransferase involved in cell wall biosynthesis